MKEEVTDAFVRAVRARCVCGGNCRYSIGDQPKRPGCHSTKSRALRLVPNCGSLLKQRDTTPPAGPHAA